MLKKSGDGLILELANNLNENKVNGQTIVKSLELICDSAAFDGGVIYDVDFSGQFCLTEFFTPESFAFCDRLAIDSLAPQERDVLVNKGISFIERDESNTQFEMRLLDIHNAVSLMLTPIVDENCDIYSLLLLFNATSKDTLSAEDFNSISVSLSMLARYVGMRMYQKKIRQVRSTFESILDNTGIDIYVNDFHSHEILYVNESMAAPYGGKGEFMGKKCWQVLFPGQADPCVFCPGNKLIDENGDLKNVYTWNYQRPFDGSWFRVFSAAFQWTDGRLAHVVSSADITENKRNEAIIENLANYDQLTKLPNRRMLIKECERRINKATSTEQGYLLFFDIDNFKLINDNYGHDSGDEFLILLGEFFSSIPLLKDAIYRNGGDEFVAIIGGEAVTKNNIRNLCSFIHDRFKKPWILKKGSIYSNTSIGVACYPEDGVTAEVLLRKSDMAMYQVKKFGGGGVYFGYQLLEGDTAGFEQES